MITFVRVATIAPGKTHEAMSFAQKVAKLVESKVGTKVDIAVPIGGNPGRITWNSSYDNLAEFESRATKLLSDADYTKLVESSAPYFLPDSTHDELWWRLPREA
jgi:hypothetical protein